MDFTSTTLQSIPRNVGVPKDAVVSIPGGRTLTREELTKLREGSERVAYEDAKIFLGRPDLLLKNPRKGAHYGWPIRNNRTAGLCRSKQYRVVAPDELLENFPYEVSPRGNQVEWECHILVEISDEAYQARYIAPAWQSTEQLARLRERLTAEADNQHLPITPMVTAKAVTA